jgi:hypothetical protein
VAVIAVRFKIEAAVAAIAGTGVVQDSGRFNRYWILTGKSHIDPNFKTILRAFCGFRINPNIFLTLSSLL